MKIVVATDFSDNSAKAILFAIQLAKQTNCSLVFYNSLYIYQPTIWETSYYNVYETEELQRTEAFLSNFIAGIFLDNNIQQIDYQCVTEIGVSAGNEIIDFALKNNVDFICMGTIGAGKLMQIFGSTASELIAFSPIPVFIIPVNYEVVPISNVFFASDFVNFDDEFYKIQELSTLLNAKIDVYHYDYQKVLQSNENKFDEISSHHKSDQVNFHLRNLDSGKPLLQQLEIEIKNENPSLVVVFTKQNRNWFERLLLSSLSDELAFDTKTPMLVFKKQLT